jgi:hypothetical protein
VATAVTAAEKLLVPPAPEKAASTAAARWGAATAAWPTDCGRAALRGPIDFTATLVDAAFAGIAVEAEGDVA